jgi:uncharacterized cupredoxin-like copper-binding protein
VRRALFPFAVLAVAIVALASAGGDGAGAAGRTVAVTLDEWTLSTDAPSVPAGRVTFETRNAGAADHELLVVRTRLDADRLRDPRFAGVYVLGAPHDHFAEAAGLRSRHIGPGRSRRDAVDLAPGDYVLFCGLPGHYAKGQRAALRVTP